MAGPRRGGGGLAIVTNGDSAAAGLAEAAPGASILPWRDMLHDGPVPAGLPLAALSALRAGWLARELGLDPAETLAAFRGRDRWIGALRPGTEVVVCLEHDLYDQLQLLQILSELAPRAAGSGLRVTLAQGDDHLGPQPPRALAALLARRRPVAGRALAAAARLWAAFRAPTPEPLAAEAGRGAVPDLPRLAPALARLLEELPDAAGLSRTERTALALLADSGGEDSAAGLFARVGGREEAAFLGDWPFFRRLEGLAAPPRPLVEVAAPGPLPPGADGPAVAAWARRRLRLTSAGREALAGGRDRLADRPPDRWLGGTHLRPGRVWRWDAAARRLGRDPA